MVHDCAGYFERATMEIGELLALLDGVLAEAPDGQGGVMADNAAMRPKVTLVKTGFEALRALAASDRPPTDDSLALVVAIKRAELRLAIGRLATEALGYQALPMPVERLGDNEAPIGGAYARLARRITLAGSDEQAEAPAMAKDRLARRLLGELTSGSAKK